VDTATVDLNGPTYPNPFAKIPAIADEDVSVFESGAILMYLADRYGGVDTAAKRANCNKWVTWANTALDPICFECDEENTVVDTHLREWPTDICTLDTVLADRKWILGDEFSVADVAIGSYLLQVLLFFPDVCVRSKWPAMAHYMKKCATRPAYAKAYGQDNADALIARCNYGSDNIDVPAGLFDTAL